MEISKETWNEINAVLEKNNIPFDARLEKADTGLDQHIQFNCVIKNYFCDTLKSVEAKKEIVSVKDEPKKAKRKYVKKPKVYNDGLVDLNDVQMDTSLPVEEKVKSYIEQIKNPYKFRVGDVAVTIRFDNSSGRTFQEALTTAILRTCDL